MLSNLIIFLRFLSGWLFTLFMSALTCVLTVLLGPKNAWLICRKTWGIGALKCIGTRLHIKGSKYLHKPAVFIANHESLIDVVILPAIVPRTTKFIAKREIKYIPFFGWAFALGGAILIDRKSPKRAIESMRTSMKKLPKHWSVLVFPEGTRSRDGQLKPFKRGAFHLAMQAKLPIVPIGLYGASAIVPNGASITRPGTVYVTIGKPIETTHWTEDKMASQVEIAQKAVLACVKESRRGEKNAR